MERTFSSINSLFVQHLAGYTGRDITRRGSDVESRAASPVADLQDLLDEWIVTGWQMRPHEGLRHPLTPDRPLSPNEAYGAMVAAAGCVPVTPTGEDPWIRPGLLVAPLAPLLNGVGSSREHGAGRGPGPPTRGVCRPCRAVKDAFGGAHTLQHEVEHGGGRSW
ncbi:hypothetical protein [Streptomyces mirabilis]|uniref:hypothetical protein n=1 Tax=Streptomyces mirabilis TaxID=68239 RepID=UPI0033F14879